MAEDSGGDNKVSIVLDLDNKEFQVKIGDAVQQFGKLGDEGHASTEKVGMGFLYVNEAIELGRKALELYHKALETMSESEAIKNQETALKNLTGTLGIESKQVVEAIKLATHGTVSEIDATRFAFKLLTSGVKADMIPALMEYGEKIVLASGNTQTLEQMVMGVSSALERGRSGELAKDWGAKVKDTGDKIELLNAILAGMKIKADHAGTGFTDLATRMTIKSAEGKEAVVKNFGEMLTELAAFTIGDKADKAQLYANDYIKQIERIKKAIPSGQTEAFVSVRGSMNEMLPVAEALVKLEAALATETKILNEENKKSSDLLKENVKELGHAATAKTRLTEVQKSLTLMIASENAAQKRYDEQLKAHGVAEITTVEDVIKAKEQAINRNYALRAQQISNESHDAKELEIKLTSLEQEKFEKINQIRVKDAVLKQSQDRAQIKIYEESYLSIEGAGKKHQAIMMAQEEMSYKKDIENLRAQGLSRDAFNREIENKERIHQKAMQEIKASSEAISLNNFKSGLGQSLNEMKNQYGNFSNFTASATKQAHSIMSKSFVDMAKNHKFSMDQMLNQVLEMIGTQMIQWGVLELFKGIAEFNPVTAGAGAGLIAAGSVLVGASASGAANTSAGSNSSGLAFGTLPPSQQPGAATANQQPSKKASIVINGYMNTKETADHLASILRENSDVTDYTITAQGRSYA